MIKNGILGGLSIVLPAKNEADNLPSLLSHISDFLESEIPNYEIWIVDDGSTDNTSDILQPILSINSKIHLLKHERNRGYGAALRTGFSSCTKEWVFWMDSDQQFQINSLKEWFPSIPDFDIIIGYRNPRVDPFHRKLNALLFKMLIRLLFFLYLKDIDCAFKLVKRKWIQGAQLESDGAMISCEILVKAQRDRLRIGEFPVKHFPRIHGAQTGAKFKVIMKAVRELFHFRTKINEYQWIEPRSLEGVNDNFPGLSNGSKIA